MPLDQTSTTVRPAHALRVDIVALRERRASLHGKGRLHWVHWLIVVASFVITVAAWHISTKAIEARANIRFEREAERVVNLLRERLLHYEDALLSGVAAVQAMGGDVTREQWRTYFEYLNLAERYPGINGFGIIHFLERSDEDEYLEVLRREHERPELEFRPEHDIEFRLPVVRLEPEIKKAAAIGFDVAFEVRRREAALDAMRSGENRMSAPIVLILDKGKTPGFLFFAPFYDRATIERSEGEPDEAARRASIRGFVYTPLVVRELAAGVLEESSRHVRFTLVDGDVVLYDEWRDDPEGKRNAAYAMTRKVEMYGRTWTFDVRSSTAFHVDSDAHQPVMVLVSGLTVDALLLALFLMMARANRRVLSLAQEVTEDLMQQAMTLSDVNQDLESFAHIVSHDLKTPIRGIQAVTEFLEEDLDDYLSSSGANPDVRRNLDMLREQTTKSDALIKGIFDYSVVGTENEPQSICDCRAMIEGIGHSTGLHPWQLDLRGDFPTFRTRSVQLGQVFANLIGNAFKYHPTPGKAVATIGVRPAGDFYRFSVADTGRGVDERFHERIFQPFTTLQREPDVHSSGIGLSIVRKSVEAVGGRIQIESVPGKGATFYFTWPVADANAAMPRAA